MQHVRFVSDDIYHEILENIRGGLWKIGDKIPSENKIAKEYSISRVSVRAAIHKLQAQGILITRPGIGSFIVKDSQEIDQGSFNEKLLDLSADDYRHMIELRRALEFTSIELLCENGSQEDIDRLRSALSDLEAASDAKGYVDADFDFHYSIILGSHNPIFKNVYDLIKEQIYKYFYELSGENRDNNWDNAIINHQKILNAIEERDAKRAIKIIEGTFEFNLNRLSKYFKQ
ncbi:MAG: FadR family transcriptional regulator [Sphaerochaeta sp.]|jgi:GntR family transcriptional repressor for pyruvate dehydrogenase complex|nr:FadR family transcriptional regulator [Sphaerochaeta sp.]